MPSRTGTIAGLVLAGGQSRRMGGGDKFMLELGGQTMLRRAVERLLPQVAAVAISANIGADMLGDLGLPVLADAPPEPRGPLSGIQAGLAWARAQGCSHLVTAASDTPFFPRDLVARLAAAGSPSSIALAASRGRTHPVFGLWPLAVAPALDGFLQEGESFKMMDFVARCGWAQVDFALEQDFDPFFNVNTRDDLAEARRLVEIGI